MGMAENKALQAASNMFAQETVGELYDRVGGMTVDEIGSEIEGLLAQEEDEEDE